MNIVKFKSMEGIWVAERDEATYFSSYFLELPSMNLYFVTFAYENFAYENKEMTCHLSQFRELQYALTNKIYLSGDWVHLVSLEEQNELAFGVIC